jgi:hypothetical protein
VKDRLRAAALALRNFLRGFTGITPVRPGACSQKDDGSRRPFCC